MFISKKIGKVCAFFGHRNTALSEEEVERLKNVIEDLIINHNVKIFLFGSRSDFDTICHIVVTQLKEKYPFIVRVRFTCKHETCVLEEDREKLEEIYSQIQKKKVRLLGFEAEFEHKTIYISGRASYVERNQAMIDNSDFCIVYFKEDYQPQLRKISKRSVLNYQRKSGTRLAVEYLKKKNKVYINLTHNKNL